MKLLEKTNREAQQRITWLARLPEENPYPVARVSAKGIVLYRNAPAAKLPGWTCEVGQPLTGPLLSLFEQVMIRGQQTVQDLELGGMTYVVWVAPFVAERYGNIYARDITDRKRAEEALRESEERFGGIVSSAMDAIISVGTDQRIIQFNAAAERMFGYKCKTWWGSR